MTRIEALEIAINAIDNAEAIEKLTALKAQIAKKRTSDKPTKNQVANEGIKDSICEILADSEPLRAGDIVKLMDEQYSLPKISALLKQLVDEGKVVKTVEKKVSRFSLA